MNFPRRATQIQELPLIPLIDVVFILIVFFMLTTNFMQTESMELLLPSAGAPKNTDDKALVRIFIHNDGHITFGERAVDEADLQKTLKALFTQDARTRIMLFSADKVSVQKLVSVMDMVYLAGGRSLFVKDWKFDHSAAAPGPGDEALKASVAR